MLFRVSRAMQAIGMIVAPVGMAGNIVRPEQITVQESLVIASVGVAIFVVGWLLQQAIRPK